MQQIEEVTVTARRRAENVLDVPISISVVTADDISRRGLIGAEDYLRGAPGVNQVDGGGLGGQAIVIRGIETDTAYQNFYTGTTVATYFGETPTNTSAGLAGSSVDIKLVDIERVELLRGPQGTAFGNSSMGGAVRTIPVLPKLDRFEGKLGAGYSVTSGTGGGNHMYQALGNVPLVENKLAIRAAAYRFSDSGFYDNRAGSNAAFQAAAVIPYGAEAFAIDEDEVGAYYATGGRIAALFQASDQLRFTLSYLTQQSEMDGFAIATSGTYEQTSLRVAPEHVRDGRSGGGSEIEVDIANAVLEYDLGWADLLATYSYVKGGSIVTAPYTGAYNLLWAASVDLTSPHRGDVGEIRLATKFDGAWNFLAGLYAEKDDDEYYWDFLWHGDPATNFIEPGARFLGNYLERRSLKQNAVFGEASWELLPGLTLTGGVRAYDYERSVRLDSSGAFGEVTDRITQTEASDANFRANLSYKLDERSLLYAGWSQGFRLGNPQVPAVRCDRDGDGFIDGTGVTLESTKGVESDTVDSYEIGGKSTLWDRRLTISAAVFRMQWVGLPVIATPPGCEDGYLTNAGAALSEGVELEGSIRVNDGFNVNFGGSWIKARLTEDVPAQGFSAGDRLPGSPKVNASLGVQYGFEIGGHQAFVRNDAIYVGSFYGDVLQSPVTKSGGYVKLDATARVMLRNLNIDLYVRNLTNEDAYTFRGSYDSGTLDDFFGYRMRPRTIGVQLGYDF